MEGRKKMEEFYRKLKVGMKLKYAFTTVIVTLWLFRLFPL